MSPIYIRSGVFLIANNAFASSQNCCCPSGVENCIVCSGTSCCDGGCVEQNCCGGIYGTGICCNNIWYTSEGVCCGDVWHTDEGVCCGGIWYTGSGNCCGNSISGTWFEPCTGNLTFYQNINGCCGCLDSENLPECCEGDCLANCCEDNIQGIPECSWKKINLCAGTIVEDCNDCTQVGCCVSGEYQGIMDATSCLSMNGYIIPTGITVCAEMDNKCSSPFDENCCMNIKSYANGLTLSQPFNKRYPPLNSTTFGVTIVGTTDSAVLINGTKFGIIADPPQRCNINHSFVICGDSFEIESLPCDSNFRCLDIEICWSENNATEATLNFPLCDSSSIILGSYNNACSTKLIYSGEGLNSEANINMQGDGTIEANGSGALILINPILQDNGSYDRTLTLTGSSNELNEIRRINNPTGMGAGDTNVEKTGSGTWRFDSDQRYFAGSLSLKEGTVYIANKNIFGGANYFNYFGDTGSGIKAPLQVLFENTTPSITTRFRITEDINNNNQSILIAGLNSLTFSNIFEIERPITIAVAIGETLDFSAVWVDSSNNTTINYNITFGHEDYLGDIQLFAGGNLDSNAQIIVDSVNMYLGDQTILYAGSGLVLNDNSSLIIGSPLDNIDSTTPIICNNCSISFNPLIEDPNPSQSINNLTVNNNKTLNLNGLGTLTINDQLNGGGNIINNNGTLVLDCVNTMSGTISIQDGTIIVNEFITNTGSKLVSATFTSSSATFDFNSDPTSGNTFKVFAGATINSYTATLTGTTATGVYNSSTSTLTIT